MDSEPSDMETSSKTEDMAIEFKKILEKGIKYLKKIEGLIDKRIETLNSNNETLDRIGSLLEGEFSRISQEILPPVDSEISNRLQEIKPKVKKLSDAQSMIKDILNQLETDVPHFTVRDLIPKVENLENIDFTQPIIPQTIEVPTSTIKSKNKKETPIPLKRGTKSRKSKSVPPIEIEKDFEDVSAKNIAFEEDISSSEAEGSKVFDEFIVSWKLKDWENIGGTKEMFINAWKKLSSYDKQKIKSGTWSKPMMEKVKLLGRVNPSGE